MISSVMNNQRLDHLLREQTSLIDGTIGRWQCQLQERLLVVLSDESHNRMRIMTPVAEVTELGEEIWLLALSANFDRALDARYAVNGDYLWSLFVHPLQELTDSQLQDALQQVIQLAENFGTSFASSDLVFGGG